MVIGESKVRAIRSEYDGRYSITVERLQWRGAWETVWSSGAFEYPCNALNQAREAGWAWLVDQ